MLCSMNSLQTLQSNNLWADLEHSRPTLLPEQASLTPMEASEDHNDTFFFPLLIGCVTYGNTGLWSTAHICAYIYVKTTHLSILQFLEIRVARGGMLLFEQYFDFFPDHFLSQQNFNHWKGSGTVKINYSGNSPLSLDTIFLQPVGLLSPMGLLGLMNVMWELHLQFGCVLE